MNVKDMLEQAMSERYPQTADDREKIIVTNRESLNMQLRSAFIAGARTMQHMEVA